jgi:hypothetical protein
VLNITGTGQKYGYLENISLKGHHIISLPGAATSWSGPEWNVKHLKCTKTIMNLHIPLEVENLLTS